MLATPTHGGGRAHTYGNAHVPDHDRQVVRATDKFDLF